MISKKIFIVLLIALTTFVGCKKDTEEFVVNDENLYTSSILGIVTDNNNNPISGAIVQFKGQTTSTDQYGVYELNKVLIGNQHNFVAITKNGYFDGCRTFRTNESRTITQETQLIQANFSNSFGSNAGGEITVGEVKLNFPADAIVNDATGLAYSGDVQVAIHHIDPIDGLSAYQMPGDLSASGDNNEIDLLHSYGMVYVRIQSTSGEKLQVAEGKTVQMTAAIPTELQNDAPNSLPMWYFNNNSGLWEKEGVATKSGNEYIAEVSHFSCWNYDDREESIVLSGRLVDTAGNPISSAHILVSATDAAWGGHGNTNSDGTFSGRVTKGKILDVSLISYGVGACRGESQFITQIGPFTSDVNIGDITLSSTGTGPSVKNLNIKAKFTDCNGNTITKGVATINGKNVILVNGAMNMTIPYCGARPTTIGLRAVDRVALKEITSSTTVTSDNIDLGTISICGTDADFVEVKSTGITLDQLFLTNLRLVMNADSSHLSASHEKQSSINLSFDSKGATTGTFDITYANVNLQENNSQPGYPKYFYNNGTSTVGTITITDNSAKSRREGSYSVTLEEEGISGSETFTGNFQIKY